MRNFHRSMTLMELIMVVVLVGILATIGAVNFRKTIINARNKEAQSTLLLIRHAEDVVRAENNAFVNCASNTLCNQALRISLPTNGTAWNYVVSGAGATVFCATATPTSADLTTYRIWQGQESASTAACP